MARFDLRNWVSGYILGLLGKPLPFTVQLSDSTLIYEGDITTSAGDSFSNPYSDIIDVSASITKLYSSDTAIVTIDDVPTTVTGVYQSVSYATFGNARLWSSTGSDTGETFCVMTFPASETIRLFTTVAGTYHVRIEKLSTTT